MTLGEILITLLIIGVVASLTVPVLKKHSQREEYATKLKKAYMTLEQSIDAASLEHGSIMKGTNVKWKMNELFKTYIVPELQVAKDCTSSASGCVTSAVSATSAIMLMDGVAIANNACTGSGTSSKCDFYIDINNTAPPNVAGVDIFKYTFEYVGVDPDKDWKFMPQGDAAKVMNAGWKITYW
jgi:type II secretory pathway pseudopilin PulG